MNIASFVAAVCFWSIACYCLGWLCSKSDSGYDAHGGVVWLMGIAATAAVLFTIGGVPLPPH